MSVDNRLAREGEELVLHRFNTGSLGLASPADLDRVESGRPANKSFWTVLKEFFSPPPADEVCAVCIPPGARLELQGIAVRLQNELAVGPVERVTFTQLTAAMHTYRDAVRFENGRELRLQEFREGLRVQVLDLSMAEEVNLERLREDRLDLQPMR